MPPRCTDSRDTRAPAARAIYLKAPTKFKTACSGRAPARAAAVAPRGARALRRAIVSSVRTRNRIETGLGESARAGELRINQNEKNKVSSTLLSLRLDAQPTVTY